jgi:dolichol-phosphate mannosyltransferase
VPHEVIFVDDGSRDETRKRVIAVLESRPEMRLVVLPRNQGQSSALVAGILAARMSHTATIDGDLQNGRPTCRGCSRWRRARRRYRPPRGPPRHGRPQARGTSPTPMRRAVLSDGASDTGCSLKVFPAAAFLDLPRFNGMHRFLPALFGYQGLSIVEVPVNHRERRTGRSKYTNLARLRRTVFDLVGVYWLSRRTIRFDARND